MYIYNLFASKMHCISNSKEQKIYQLKYNTCTMQNTHKEKYVSSSLHLHVCKILLKNPINILKLCLNQTEKKHTTKHYHSTEILYYSTIKPTCTINLSVKLKKKNHYA